MVLIETYWNVNVTVGEEDGVPYLVLIETYWNVNDGLTAPIPRYFDRINRNILECKYGSGEPPDRRRKVLIETYWNVNYG